MSSITKSGGPRPKLRVTFLRRTPGCPHEAQSWLGEVGGNDEEVAERPDFDDDFGISFFEREATDDTFDLLCSGVSLALDDFASEDDVFKVINREVVIV